MRILGVISIVCALCITGCMALSGAWTGASLIYDRHGLYKKLDDYQLNAAMSHALFHDDVFKKAGASIELSIFHGDVLLVGAVPTEQLRQLAYTRALKVPGYRRLYLRLIVATHLDTTAEDAWITAKIRSQMMANSDIDPYQFKVVTFNYVVYLMGDALREDAARVLEIARQVDGVEKVVKLFKYYKVE